MRKVHCKSPNIQHEKSLTPPTATRSQELLLNAQPLSSRLHLDASLSTTAWIRLVFQVTQLSYGLNYPPPEPFLACHTPRFITDHYYRCYWYTILASLKPTRPGGLPAGMVDKYLFKRACVLRQYFFDISM